jgi:DNA-binding CsgD family transcriptional regulator/tetratricopeptide (TPR) repeat protein
VASVSSPIIVGRDEELARIERALDEAAGGRPRLLFVTGEAGIGKSRLVREAVDRARAAGSPIMLGTCLDIGQGWLPYLPVAEALRGLIRDLDPRELDRVIGPARPDLARIVPTLARQGLDQADVSASSTDEPSLAERARLFERFIGVIGRLSERRPLLAVVEDVQWIDPATRDLLTFLVHNMTTEPIAAILTIRTEELSAAHPVTAWLAELGRAPGAVRIDLARLDRSGVARQVEAIAGTTLDDDVTERLWQRSEGNPLFAEELLASELRLEDAARPSLVEVLLARIAALGEEGQVVLEALAVAGRPADERLLAPVVEQDVRSVGRLLRDAVARGIAIVLPDGRYRFRHELVRELVEGELPIAQRRDLHERFARRLEERPDLAAAGPTGPAGELARHWTQADMPAEAYRAALAAAAAAESVNAVEQAHQLLATAISLEPSLPDDTAPDRATRIEIRRRAADAADLAGTFGAAIALTNDALALVDPDEDPTTAGLLHARLGYLKWVTGDASAGLEEHHEAVRLVPEEPPSRTRARVLGGLAGGLMGLGRWEESREVAIAAIECAMQAGAVPEESRSRNFLGSDLVALGDVDAGLAELRRSHELALEAGPPDLVIVAGYNLGLNLMLAADRHQEALAITTSLRDRAREVGLERRFGMDLGALAADNELRMGRWSDADATTLEALALDQRQRGTAYLAAVRSRLAALRGSWAESERRLSELEDLSDEPDLAAYVGAVRAETSLARDEPAEAVDASRSALAVLNEPGIVIWAPHLIALGLRALADLAESARAAHDQARGKQIATDAKPFTRAAADVASRAVTPSGRAWLATATAEQARLDGEPQLEAWEAAVAAWDDVPDPFGAAYAQFRQAEATLRAQGIKADVAPLLRSAHDAAETLGAAPLRRQIEELAGRARVDLRPLQPVMAAPSPEPSRERGGTAVAVLPHRLSAREVEVLRLVAAGRTNGEIAEELFITRKTAGVHVTHILDKLGVSNRVEAAMAAARLGLAPGPDEDGRGG